MAIDLNGSTERILITANNDFAYDANFTINIWINSTSYAGTPYIHDYHGTNNRLAIALSAAGVPILIFSGGPTMSGGSVTNGKWHMITATRIGTVVTLYLDAVSVDTDTKAGAVGINSQDVKIAALGGGDSNKFPGKIGMVELYKGKGLSLAEVQSKYHSKGADGIVDSLVFRGLFNEGAEGANPGVNQPIDVSDGGHVITIVAGASYVAVPFRLIK